MPLIVQVVQEQLALVPGLQVPGLQVAQPELVQRVEPGLAVLFRML
jgi:hypothetical protein